MVMFVVVVVVLWIASFAAWSFVSSSFKSVDSDKIKSRLLGEQARAKRGKAAAKAVPPLIQTVDQKTGKLTLRLLEKYRLQDRLQGLLEQAGLKWNVARLVHSCLAMFLLGFAIAWFTIPGAYQQFAFLVGAVLSTLPLLYVMSKAKRRIKKFEEQFPDSLEFVARSMRAGHAFSVSLEMIHREFQEPLAGEFRRAFDEHNLGLPLDVALEKLSKRVPLLDVHFFVSAVLLQKRTGGNLAEILDKLAYVIRERFKLRGRIRAISAHGRMTGTALTCIPIGVAVMMFWVNPDYVKFFFTDEVGQLMMGAAVGLQLIGYAIIRKIVAIEV
ncbi:MAG: type II secretion system F family protein [Bryobacteraceae bacterium]